MAVPSFAPGQRWISNTEAELGLGVVVEVANRRVCLSFPAAGERRIYAVDNAPVTRVRYHVGEKVTSLDGDVMEVTDVSEDGGCLIYRGTDLVTGEEASLAELELDSFVQFSSPKDRLLSGQIDKLQRFDLRCETLTHLREHQQSNVSGLLGPRVQLLPHQLFIAHEAGNRYAPRVLLADEVGLGKTIEAGLILHQQLNSGRAQRALIVVPDSLVHQWLVEMLRRFNLQFTILDEERCEAIEGVDPLVEDATDPLEDESGFGEIDNPFDSAQLVLCSLSFLLDNPRRQEQALDARWDMLLVDEAHHLAWSEEQASPAYQCIEDLSQVARGLLLLTATPEQLGLESHFARLRLLDPDRYYDLEKFKQEEAGYAPVNALVQRLMALVDDNSDPDAVAELLRELENYLGEDSVAAIENQINEGEVQDAVAAATAELLDRHGTGRVLFRNTRANVEGFPERQLLKHALSAPAGFAEASAAAALEEKLYPEHLLAGLHGECWLEEDPRLPWLVDFLKQNRGEKILLICAHASTAIQLEEHLNLREGMASAVFHEGLSLVARDRAAAYFADAEEGAQVLVCSEIGSEGRNFQFSHNLVLFDLPLNPDLLEQRIGRLDRIGQRHTVKIHVPVIEDSAQEVLLAWFDQGIDAFSSACPAGQLLFDTFEQSLYDVVANPNEAGLSTLLQESRQLTEETLQRLQEGRDRLLELNSCNHQRAAGVVDAVLEGERRYELEGYMERVFDQFGVDQDRHSAVSVVLHPSDHMLTPIFPGLSESGMTATYQREMALSREDVHFLTWEHPMVSGTFEMILGGDFGNTALATVKLPPLKPGTLLVEAIYTLECTAPRMLQVSRYLPLTTVRVVVDAKGNSLGHVLTPEKLSQLVQKVPRGTAQDLVRHAREDIAGIIKLADKQAEPQEREEVEAAIARMQAAQQAEITRLTELAKVNPNIRGEEIDYLHVETEALEEFLQNASLRQDALRVIVAV